MYKILFATSEVYPIVKTGGLADVSRSLPRALKSLHHDVRIIVPAYRQAVAVAGKLNPITRVKLLTGEATILEGILPGSLLKVWLVDYPPLYGRSGDPYLGPDGTSWRDNAERFAFFSRVVVEIALNRAKLSWQPDIVHCNDWQTGLVPALLTLETDRPATVFTIHNLAYQGLFPYSTFAALDLPRSWWSFTALEFHGRLSFIKGGLVFADRVNTVSPSYAKEIQTPEYGCGLHGLLSHEKDRLSGILNGIDTKDWDPGSDPYLIKTYNKQTLKGKSENKAALQKIFRLPQDPKVPLIGLIGRLVHQKGIDLVIEALPEIMALPVQMVLLGSGDASYEDLLFDLSVKYPKQLSVRIGYDEALAHMIEAGSDMFLMPSRFEPCGLNQMYSQHYGTVPVVRRAGGLADTVIDANDANQKAKISTGIMFENMDVTELLIAIERALELYLNNKVWKTIQLTGMKQDFSWRHSAKQYELLYKQTLESSIQEARDRFDASRQSSRHKHLG